MMCRTWAAAALLLFLLTGCGGQPRQEVQQEKAPIQVETLPIDQGDLSARDAVFYRDSDARGSAKGRGVELVERGKPCVILITGNGEEDLETVKKTVSGEWTVCRIQAVCAQGDLLTGDSSSNGEGVDLSTRLNFSFQGVDRKGQRVSIIDRGEQTADFGAVR